MIDHITNHIFYTTLRVRKITAAVNNISLKYLIFTPTRVTTSSHCFMILLMMYTWNY